MHIYLYTMVHLDLDVFLSEGGIFRSTIHSLFNCDEFFLQRQQVVYLGHTAVMQIVEATSLILRAVFQT